MRAGAAAQYVGAAPFGLSAESSRIGLTIIELIVVLRLMIGILATFFDVGRWGGLQLAAHGYKGRIIVLMRSGEVQIRARFR